MSKSKFYTRFNPPPKVIFNTTGVSKAKQNFKDDADINVLVKRYTASGYDSRLLEKKAIFYGDFSRNVDLAQAHDVLNTAETEFAALPSRVRDAFDNNPSAFFKVFTNEDAFKSHRKLFEETGIITRTAPQELPTAVPPSKGDNVDNSPPQS